MLIITVPSVELFDEEKEEFIDIEGRTLELEHSLASLSKWEEIFEKPFLVQAEKTQEELLAYVRCMASDPHTPPEIFLALNDENYQAITKYIDAKMTATWFSENAPPSRTGETLTAELIYYWMIALEIPMEWEHRHLNKLFTLIKVIDRKRSKPKKKSHSEMASERARENERRLAAAGHDG